MEDEGGSRQNADVGRSKEGSEEQPTALQRVNGLQTEAQACLARLDVIGKSLKQAARDVAKQPPSFAASSARADIAHRMENLANIDSQIDFTRQKLERQREESVNAKIRFSEMEKSIKQRESHVKNLQQLLHEIPDDD